MGLKVEPKIVKIGSRRVFCVTEKTLNSASVFFRAFTVSGTPGPSPIVNFPLLKNNTVFYKTMSKLVPSATPKTIGNLKNLIFTTVENYVFFCYRFFKEFVGK